jgi:uncharacterized protein YjiS (DUF1127 family)
MYSEIYGKAVVLGQRRSLSRTLEAAVIRAVDRLLLWNEHARTRRLLGGLDDHMLHDIGIDRATAEREAAAPFWR